MAAGDLIMAQVVDGQPFFPCGPCAGTSEECCLYPWPDPDGALIYPGTDLPASLSFTIPEPYISAGTYTVVNGGIDNFIYEYYADWLTIIVTAHGPDWSFAWERTDDPESGGGTGNCLISTGLTYSVEDEFPDTLNVDGGSLLRNTPCYWSGTVIVGEDEIECSVNYMTDPPVAPPLDELGNPWPTKPFFMFVFGVGTLEQYFAKDDPQNSPVGTYGSGVVTVT